MNRKSFVIISVLISVFTLNLTATNIQSEQLSQEEIQKRVAQRNWEMTEVVKTYQLKHIKPDELINATKLYIIDFAVHKNTVSVKILNKNVATFEELLKKIDVEKKSILFKVYTIAATRDSEKEEIQEKIEDKGLKQVLDELKNLWNFQSYKIDKPFFITVKEETGSNYFRLGSEIHGGLGLRIQNVNINLDKPGKRDILIGQIQLLQASLEIEYIVMDSKSITVKEDGYLVVGVSGMMFTRGKVLILVISAEIKD